MKFKLLFGTFEADHPEHKFIDPSGRERFRNVTYGPGATIESHTDLCKKFNGADGMTPKFQRIHDDDRPVEYVKSKPVLVDLASLEKKSQKDLVDWAADHEIDIEGATTKADVLTRIKSALGA